MEKKIKQNELENHNKYNKDRNMIEIKDIFRMMCIFNYWYFQ